MQDGHRLARRHSDRLFAAVTTAKLKMLEPPKPGVNDIVDMQGED
jgi:hypothetical protein